MQARTRMTSDQIVEWLFQKGSNSRKNSHFSRFPKKRPNSRNDLTRLKRRWQAHIRKMSTKKRWKNVMSLLHFFLSRNPSEYFRGTFESERDMTLSFAKNSKFCWWVTEPRVFNIRNREFLVLIRNSFECSQEKKFMLQWHGFASRTGCYNRVLDPGAEPVPSSVLGARTGCRTSVQRRTAVSNWDSW